MNPLVEYEAARGKLDETLEALAERADDALSCASGCAQCCAPGLSVLPIEAYAIQSHMEAHPITHAPRDGVCVFLDEADRCSVYAARPFLCRTHGFALRTDRRDRPGTSLRIFETENAADAAEIETCGLNYEERAPRGDEVLDARAVQALLTTVNARFLPILDEDVPDRVLLSALLAAASGQLNAPEA